MVAVANTANQTTNIVQDYLVSICLETATNLDMRGGKGEYPAKAPAGRVLTRLGVYMLLVTRMSLLF